MKKQRSSYTAWWCSSARTRFHCEMSALPPPLNEVTIRSYANKARFGVFPLQARITTRLQQYRAKAELSRNTRPQAWVPREKLPRPLTSSASAIRKLMRKAELMGISTDIFPVDTSDANASIDGRRKHKQPALTADFVNYYLGKKNWRPPPFTADVLFVLSRVEAEPKPPTTTESVNVSRHKLFVLPAVVGQLEVQSCSKLSTPSFIPPFFIF